MRRLLIRKDPAQKPLIKNKFEENMDKIVRGNKGRWKSEMGVQKKYDERLLEKIFNPSMVSESPSKGKQRQWRSPYRHLKAQEEQKRGMVKAGETKTLSRPQTVLVQWEGRCSVGASQSELRGVVEIKDPSALRLHSRELLSSGGSGNSTLLGGLWK